MRERINRWRRQRFANRFARLCREADTRLKGLGMKRAERRRFFREIAKGLSMEVPKGPDATT